MTNPFLGQIQAFAFGVVPRGWAQCNGQLMSINTNQPLFSLLGTMYGGDGRTTFALPDLRGRVAAGVSASLVQGSAGGEENHALVTAEMPKHTHPFNASATTAKSNAPTGNYLAAATSSYFSTASPNANLGTGSTTAGTSQPHPNLQPYLALNFCIALQGIFPSRN